MIAIDTAHAATRPRATDDAASTCGRCIEGHHVFVLADALGTQAQATRASERAVSAFADSIQSLGGSGANPQEKLCAAIRAANMIVHDHELPMPACLAFVTSIVAALPIANRLLLAHAGNARCYRFRAGNRTLLTRPHTVIAEMPLDEGLLFATHNWHMLTRALGIGRLVEPELSEHVLRSGDRLVLVNDALSRIVEEPEVAELLSHRLTAGAVASSIAGLADQRGASGSVLALQVVGDPDGRTATESEPGYQ